MIKLVKPSEILSLLSGTVSVKNTEETPDRYTSKVVCTIPNTGIRASLPQLILNSGFPDRLMISITVGTAPFTFISDAGDNTPFFDEWEKFQQQADSEDKADILLTIDKRIHYGNEINIYDSGAFFRYLDSLTPVELINIFSKQYKRGSHIYFVCPDFESEAYTNSIHFVADHVHQKGEVVPIDHLKIWERLNAVTHFGGISECLALPEDFRIIEGRCMPDSLQKKFNKACLVLTLSVIYDFAAVQGDTLYLKLNGYKTFNIELSIDQLKLDSLPIYYQIYQWVVSSGSIQDKIGLSRNLVSLNIDATDKYTLTPSVYTSILSGFKVYEKQNVKQYIELRNKMSDQLISFNEKAGKIVETFAGSFQKSALAVVTLYASIIVTRVLSSHDSIVNVFTPDATILSFTFLTASLAYFFVSRWEVKVQKIRFKESYQNMKMRNEDLLTPDDIEKILNNNKEHNADVAFINDKQKWYTWLWIGFLILFSVTTLVLFGLYLSRRTVQIPVVTGGTPVQTTTTIKTAASVKNGSPIIDSLHRHDSIQRIPTGGKSH